MTFPRPVLLLTLAFFSTAAVTPAQQAASPSPAAASSLQNSLYGSVPSGNSTSETLQLSLADAIQRGLKQNLSALLAGDSQISAHGQLWEQKSKLLPAINGGVSENGAEVNLLAEGFGPIAAKFPGFPTVVGPFPFFDVRARANASVFNLSDWDNERSAERSLSAANFNYQDVREMVVLTISAAYLQTISLSATVETASAQRSTAQALYDQATDLKKVGASAGIDLLRAQVELQTRQQQLIAAQNDLSKQKLVLARMIGLPLGQGFVLSDAAPYQPTQPAALDDLLKNAYAARADFQGALAEQHAAEYSLKAAHAEHLPSGSLYADYGAIGPTPSQLRGTFTASASLNVPIFTGNRAHADALIADAAVQRARQRVENLRAQIEQDVRNALLDLQSASDQVQVAKSNVDLAQQTLTEARDRFSAGATDNIEVVQAQESVASANSAYISSLFAYNLARVDLARATGNAERGILQFWKEQ